MKQPVIFIGMHRSGTSMISWAAEQCGLFVGKDLQNDYESSFFLKLNEWILRQANASWDNPYNFTCIDDHFKKQIRRVIDKQLSGFNKYRYLGIHMGLRYRTLKDIDFNWGWKDPRNTFTLEIWREVFPKAKVVHIYRNPIDVAESLWVREQQFGNSIPTITDRIKEKLLIGKCEFSSSVRLSRKKEGIMLWREFIEKAFSFENNTEMLHVRYESFLDDPEKGLERILDFIGMHGDKTDYEKVVLNINRSRKFSFLEKDELKKLYLEILPDNISLLCKLNYDRLV